MILFTLGVEIRIASAAVPAKKMEGTWHDRTQVQAAISITEKDGFIDLLGKDIESIYSCAGIIEENSVTCFGSGINHDVNLRFLYKSHLKLIDGGQRLEEKWEAFFAGGKRLEGKTIFYHQKSVPGQIR